ncbi:hypothetical protein HDU93_009333 [Gonapodya sp. JEL0774]|nr:hypothetical protein HDU93_009333 [Gonapodya sp. JEL0774]
MVDCSDCTSMTGPLLFGRLGGPRQTLKARWLRFSGSQIQMRDAVEAGVDIATLEVAEWGSSSGDMDRGEGERVEEPLGWHRPENSRALYWSRLPTGSKRPPIKKGEPAPPETTAATDDAREGRTDMVPAQEDEATDTEQLEEELARVRKRYLDLVARVKESDRGKEKVRGSGHSSGGSSAQNNKSASSKTPSSTDGVRRFAPWSEDDGAGADMDSPDGRVNNSRVED